jgi:RNA polymerase sigma-70 factor, ECF subfamily
VETGPPYLSDEELARQSRAGSLSAFEELVHRYERRIFLFLARCCRNEDDARELTQTAFVTAYRSLHLYDPASAFGAWLFTIARRKFIDHCRAARPLVDLESAPEPCDLDDPSAVLSMREQEEDLWRGLRSLLSADQFAALWLKYREEMSVKDIARILSRSQTSVKVLLFRARQTLLKTSARVPGLEAAPPDPRLADPPSRALVFTLARRWERPSSATNLTPHRE